MNKTRYPMLAGILALALTGCGAPGSNDNSGDTGAPPATAQSLGVIRISVEGLGSPTPTATAENLDDPAAAANDGAPQAHALSTKPCFLQIQSAPVSSGAFNTGGEQYVSFTFKVRNAQGVTTTGCTANTPYGTLSNVTLMGLVEPGLAIGATPFISLKEFDGTNEPASVATTILPTHGMQFNAEDNVAEVAPGQESFQAYSESALSTLAIDPEDKAGSYLLPYGYVVRNVDPARGRTLQASPQSGEYDGEFTFAVKVPVPGSLKTAVYSFQYDLQVLVDSSTRVTQSIDEQNLLGDFAAALRAATLGSTDVAVLGGRVAQLNHGDPVCTVRIAGTAAAPTAHLVSSPTTSLTLASAPYNLQNIAPGDSIQVGYCLPMTPAVPNQFVVSGSQSGAKGTALIESGGSPNGWLALQPETPFLPGEQVSYTLTTGLTSTNNLHPAAFVGTYITGGLTPSLGEFRSNLPRSYTAGPGPQALATGDFNGDGYPDLAVANYDIGSVSVFINNGDGSYAAPVNYNVGSSPNSIAVIDTYADGGHASLAVANSGSSTVSVLVNKGNGTGTFNAAANYAVGNSPQYLVVADFGNGQPDIAVSNGSGSSVTVLMNTGNLHYGAGQTTAVGGNPQQLVAGFFNNDAIMDLAVVNRSSNTISILIGNGSGGFTNAAGSPISVPALLGSITTADFNHDGKADLAVASGSISVLLGHGDGTFGAAANYGGIADAISAVDLNGDGVPDLESISNFQNSLSVLFGKGDGSFAPPVKYSTGSPNAMAFADLNGDNHPDVVLADTNDEKISTMMNTGIGTFPSPAHFATGLGPLSVTAANLSGNGKLSLAVANSSANSITVLVGDGAGGFTPATGSPFSTGSYPSGVVAADFNADGKLDLATANCTSNNLSILLGSGSGAFGAHADYLAGGCPVALASADFNRDGKPDVVVVNQNTNNISILLGTGSGSVGTAVNYAVGSSPDAVAVGDFNGDGKLDLAVTNSSDSNVSILLGHGDGTFAAQVVYSTGNQPTAVAVGDFDGDGKIDLAVAAAFQSNFVSVLHGTGNGTFAAAVHYPTGATPTALTVGDFNGDGKPDLITANVGDNTISVLLNRGGTFAPAASYVGAGAPTAITAGAFTASPQLGLAITSNSGNQVVLIPQ